MSDLKLFRIGAGGVCAIPATSVAVEKTLQTLIEAHSEAFLGVRFLASEYITGSDVKGRIDTLGIDENNSPVIIEYKRALNENVINQGLFYLNWLMNHQKDFAWLVMKQFGVEAAEAIEWSTPRLVCIAGDFTKYDEHAIHQMPRNIELIRYRRYGEDLLLFELVNAAVASLPGETGGKSDGSGSGSGGGKKAGGKTIAEKIATAPFDVQNCYAAIRDTVLALGDDVQEAIRQDYVAFRRIKNFACVEVLPHNKTVVVYVKIDPDSLVPEPGFKSDARIAGHFGTGDLKIVIDSDDDLARATPLIPRSYEAS